MSTTIAALQDTLADEYAAVYVFGTLGAQTSQSGQPDLYQRLLASYTLHRGRRDQLIRALRDRNVSPEPAAPAYELPNDASSPTLVNRAAAQIEAGCAAAYADLVASTSGELRRWAIGALRDAAVRELGYRGAPSDFPGVTELANH